MGDFMSKMHHLRVKNEPFPVHKSKNESFLVNKMCRKCQKLSNLGHKIRVTKFYWTPNFLTQIFLVQILLILLKKWASNFESLDFWRQDFFLNVKKSADISKILKPENFRQIFWGPKSRKNVIHHFYWV